MQTQWKVLLGLLGTAALVTIITVPVVLLNKDSKFETLEKDKAGGDQDLVLVYPTEENKRFCWGLGPVRQVIAEACQALLLLVQQLGSLLSLQCSGCENLEAATFYAGQIGTSLNEGEVLGFPFIKFNMF